MQLSPIVLQLGSCQTSTLLWHYGAIALAVVLLPQPPVIPDGFVAGMPDGFVAGLIWLRPDLSAAFSDS